jgi:hypothetical protein
VLVLQIAQPPLVLAVGHHSGHLVAEIIRSAPLIGLTLFWSLLVPWLACLLVLTVRPLNIGAMQLLEARYPLSKERSRIDRLWPQVLARTGVSRTRYTVLVVDADDAIIWVQRDLGLHVVAVAEEALAVLDDDALAAVLAQRLARQRTHLALLGGLFIWAALPLIAILFVGVMAFRAVRGTGKTFLLTTRRARSKTMRRVGIGLSFYLVGMLAFYLMGMLAFHLVGIVCMATLRHIVVALTVVVLVAILAILLIAWLGRQAELAADLVAIQWGYGPGLRDGMVRLGELDSSRPLRPVVARLAALFSPYPPASKHLAHLDKTELSPQTQQTETDQ